MAHLIQSVVFAWNFI